MNLAIFNARMNSSRFPGKLMQPLYTEPSTKEEKSVLQMFLERMKTVESWDHMVLAVPKDPINQPLLEVAEKMGVDTWQSEIPAEDALGRVKEAADHYHANTVIRVTPDCPALHRDIIHRVCIAAYINRNGAHYFSNCWHRGVGAESRFPRGMEVEAISYAMLEQMEIETGPKGSKPSPYDREHVTTFIRRYPRVFGHVDVPPTNSVRNISGMPKSVTEAFPARLTLDYPEDLDVLRNVFRELQPTSDPKTGYFDLTDISALYKAKPELFKANAHIEQRG